MGFNGSGGGSGSVASSSDVALNSPVNNDVLTYDTSTSKWKNKVAPAAAVSSVASKTGAVTLVKADVGLGNVDNTSDVNKPISTAAQTALNTKIDVNTLANTWGVLPVIAWTGSAWPARTLPSGYVGAVVWDSATDQSAPAPSASISGDRWLRRVA